MRVLLVEERGMYGNANPSSASAAINRTPACRPRASEPTHTALVYLVRGWAENTTPATTSAARPVRKIGRWGSSAVRLAIHAPLMPTESKTSGPTQQADARLAATPPGDGDLCRLSQCFMSTFVEASVTSGGVSLLPYIGTGQAAWKMTLKHSRRCRGGRRRGGRRDDSFLSTPRADRQTRSAAGWHPALRPGIDVQAGPGFIKSAQRLRIQPG